MTRQGDHRQIKFSVIFFIVAALSIVPAVTGLGDFHLKILSVDVSDLQSICSPGADSPCKANDNLCGNNTVVLKTCLSHHQLPLPYTLQCTFGTGELTIPYVVDGNSKGNLWKPDVVMTIPFTFSWPGGFSLSVSAFWDCPLQESPDVSPESHISVADYIFPSLHWTVFTNSHSPKEITLANNNFQHSSHTSISSNEKTSHNRAARNSRHQMSSYDTLSKIIMVNSSEVTHKNSSSLQVDSSSRETDSNVNIHTTNNSQTTSTGIKILEEKSEVFRTNIQWKSKLEMDVVESDSTDDTIKDSKLHVLSTVAVIRHRGMSLSIAARVVCQEHYFGKSCTKLCRPRDDLLGHYGCSDTGDIVCLEGWTGNYCTEAVCSDRCISTRGTCTSPGTCTCRHGWFGEHCEKCRTHSGCKHGLCHVPDQCLCHKGWTGPLCDVEELFCLEHKPCQNGGVCLHDNAYNYTCSCPAGYTGTHCEVPQCHNNFCLHGGKCQISEGTRYCLCSLPFSGPRCQDRQTSLDIQSSNISCISTNCSHHSDLSHQQALQSQNPCLGSSCFSEFLQPISCQGHLCYNKGRCILHPDSKRHECACPFPFFGPQCLQVADPCQSNPCKNETMCVTTDSLSGSFTCVCAPGYFGEMCNFKMVDSSTGNTVCDDKVICQHGGLCERWKRSGQFFCKCLPDFTGEFCEMDNKNPCSSYTCLNGGSCVIGQHNEPQCVCENGYSGSLCHILPGSICSRVVCQHGGTCLEHDDEFACACRKNFEGIFCEKKLRKRERSETIRLETLTIRNEKLEIRIQTNVKSAGGIIISNSLSATFLFLETWIACVVLAQLSSEIQFR